jgi:hypothetical protein
MKNLYVDALRAAKRRPVVQWLDDEIDRLQHNDTARQEAADQVHDARKAALLEYLQALPPKDREILTITAEFWDSQNHEVVVDKAVRIGICREHGLTESSLRVRRKRLKDRAKAFISEQTEQR